MLSLTAPGQERDHETREDLFYGQVVLIVARWFLIVAGVVLALWSARSIAEVTVPIGFMIVLMIVNFYLHGRYLLKRPVNAFMVYVSSAVDLLIITLIVLFWTQGQGAGLPSPFFIFLYPALLAFALVFPPRTTLGYAAGAVAIYLLVVLIGSGVGDLDAQKVVLQRLVTLGATAGLGTYFWRIQRQRRRDALATRASLWRQLDTTARKPAPVR